MLSSSIIKPGQSSICGLNRYGNFAKTPGSRTGVELTTVTTSRKFVPIPKPASNAAITVAAGLQYSLDSGSWTSNAGTWGSSKYCQVRLTSSESYLTDVTKAITINGVALDFTVTTKADPATLLSDRYTDTDNYTDLENYT